MYAVLCRVACCAAPCCFPLLRYAMLFLPAALCRAATCCVVLRCVVPAPLLTEVVVLLLPIVTEEIAKSRCLHPSLPRWSHPCYSSLLRWPQRIGAHTPLYRGGRRVKHASHLLWGVMNERSKVCLPSRQQHYNSLLHTTSTLHCCNCTNLL